jgi:hypothetical protein
MRRAWPGAGQACEHPALGDDATGICVSIYSNFLPLGTPEVLTVIRHEHRTPLQMDIGTSEGLDRKSWTDVHDDTVLFIVMAQPTGIPPLDI